MLIIVFTGMLFQFSCHLVFVFHFSCRLCRRLNPSSNIVVMKIRANIHDESANEGRWVLLREIEKRLVEAEGVG